MPRLGRRCRCGCDGGQCLHRRQRRASPADRGAVPRGRAHRQRREPGLCPGQQPGHGAAAGRERRRPAISCCSTPIPWCRPAACRCWSPSWISTPARASSGPRLVYGDGSFQHGAFHFPTLSMALFDFWTDQPSPHRLAAATGAIRAPGTRPGAPFPIDHPLGAALTDPAAGGGAGGPAGPRLFHVLRRDRLVPARARRRAGRSIVCPRP